MSTVLPKLPDGEVVSFWPQFVDALRRRIDPAHYDTWFVHVRCKDVSDAHLELVAPNSFTRDWIQRHFVEEIRDAARRIDGNARVVRVLAPPEVHADDLERSDLLTSLPGGEPSANLPKIPLQPVSRPPSPPADRATAAPSVTAAPRPTPALGASGTASPDPGSGETRLNPVSLDFFQRHTDFSLTESFTFEQFVTGSCNDLAYASARAVAEFPGGPYNPLFIHGSSGLGKTHLLQAVCHAVLRSRTPRRILYLSCESFVNQFIQAVTNGDLEAFRYKYRKVDMLLLDDVQFLEGKTRTQEEFFHTFNTLHNAQRQIVLTSDRPPRAIATLQDRLVSRFRWGMVCKIDTPCLETRVAILKRKARFWGVELPDDVAQCLAEFVDTNIRELEGAVTKVIGYANLVGRRLELATVHEALQDTLARRSEVTIHQILELVAKEFGVLPKELQSKRRAKSVALARHVGIYLARQHTRLVLAEIGGFFGGRDHSTVLHSISRVEALCASEADFAARVKRLRAHLDRG